MLQEFKRRLKDSKKRPFNPRVVVWASIVCLCLQHKTHCQTKCRTATGSTLNRRYEASRRRKRFDEDGLGQRIVVTLRRGFYPAGTHTAMMMIATTFHANKILLISICLQPVAFIKTTTRYYNFQVNSTHSVALLFVLYTVCSAVVLVLCGRICVSYGMG